MTIDMQSLNDAIIAVVVTVGIAAAVSLALVAAGALFGRDTRRARRAVPALVPAQQPTLTDDIRELVHQ